MADDALIIRCDHTGAFTGAMSRAKFSSGLFVCMVMGVRELLPAQRLAVEALLDGKGRLSLFTNRIREVSHLL